MLQLIYGLLTHILNTVNVMQTVGLLTHIWSAVIVMRAVDAYVECCDCYVGC